ncbi:MAG: flagellar hook-length control protein FliK [Rhodocyclaceae bacterium]|nr:flagellar hook-length control protein FliK [Rhodocyclaceae bacterium]
MALAPVDVGLRLKLQSEADLVQPLRPTHAIPAELPELAPGQTFRARILEALPENTFRALVAGKTVTLALPEGAKPGDELELLVIDRSPKAILARRIDGAGEGAAEEASAYPWVRMSATARMIGELLPAAGQTAKPAPLSQAAAPLFPAPPAMTEAAASVLAPRLQQAVSESGVFYEAHLVQWLQQKRPLADLFAEPHARLAAAAFEAAHEATPAAFRAPPSQESSPQTGEQRMGAPAERLPGALEGRMSAATVPEPLRPIVAQQLEALASQRLVWQGELWPGFSATWEIDWRERQEKKEKGTEPEAELPWRTRLTLALPGLGAIDARLALFRETVELVLETADEAASARLRAELPELAQAFAGIGLALRAIDIRTPHGSGG